MVPFRNDLFMVNHRINDSLSNNLDIVYDKCLVLYPMAFFYSSFNSAMNLAFNEINLVECD